jgi:hypothetical protein
MRGILFARTATDSPTASGTASPSPTAAANPPALATTGGPSLLWPLTLVAALVLIAIDAAGVFCPTSGEANFGENPFYDVRE